MDRRQRSVRYLIRACGNLPEDPHRSRGSGTPQARPSTSFFSRALITLGVAGSVLAFVGDAVYSTTYTLLRPTGPDGCQAVVREASFLVAGQGQVYAVHPCGVGWRTGSWRADDGIRPIDEGRYKLPRGDVPIDKLGRDILTRYLIRVWSRGRIRLKGRRRWLI